ncbi:phosphatidylserine decarboxylase family protein [Parapedobacter sp. 10938]|uniref:phosphatidylserine decarboxylase family protein n=1 Tax=Parapedobacter flavus TaxID=3110225 RepID=UPI002DB9C9C8|nr:phosphatidylserine decarboxylase family protein [Parapedobacter sp. 10938]MEC3880627.1 phosphatidylserine decarboxylase family protein [Parapedobacter sp. 10938]
MTIHKEGYTSIAIVVLVILVANALVHYFVSDNAFIVWATYLVSFLLFVTVLQFFRNPRRRVITDEKNILCPADGKVVVIEETEETEYFHDKRIQVSIFMSPVNVHINRNPVSGKVSFFRYHSGKYLVAWHPKSSTLNERTSIAVQTAGGKEVLFRQIAGAMARRIVWYVQEGSAVTQGEEFGFIKFGSRVDVFLPLGTKVNVNIGDRVSGGLTVLGRFD